MGLVMARRSVPDRGDRRAGPAVGGGCLTPVTAPAASTRLRFPALRWPGA
jgi:hypothetical protein